MNIFRFILRYGRIFTLLAVVLPVVAGIVAYQNLPKEGNPEITVPVIIVITPYVGASPNEVESLVTTPIEEEIGNISDIKELSSYSSSGVSVVVVEFDVDTDMEEMLQKVRDKVNRTRKFLPDGIEEPEIEEINISEIPIMIVSLVGDMDPIRLKRLAEDVADELKFLPEVLETDVAGGLSREIQVYLDPDRLSQYGLTILDVARAISTSDISIPGGEVTISDRKFTLRTLTEVKQVSDYANIPLIERGDRVVFLGDVAEIVDGHEEDITYSRVQGQSSVSIAVKKRPGANILETAQKIRDRLTELEKTFPVGIHSVVTADQSKYIKQSFNAMTNSALSGLFVVICVLYFALGFRNSIIASLAIPLSLLITFILLNLFGLSNNDMVRFSLVLCIGLLVDNAIIVVESAYYHYQLGKDRLTAVIDGVSEIALPVISATLTTVAAFLPMLLMSGMMGKFMGFMPKTVAIALFSSLIVALVSNPLILSRFMKRTVKKGRIVRPEEDLKRLKALYVRFVVLALNHRLAVICVMLFGLIGVAGVFGLKIIKIEMFPEADFDYIYITVDTPPGTGVDVTDAIAQQVERVVNDHVPEVVRVVSSIGYRGQSAYEVSIGGTQSNYAEITVELLDSKEFKRASDKEIKQRIRPMLDPIPGADIRFRALQWGPPTGSPINLKIYGNNLNTLKRISSDVKEILAEIPGAVEIKDDFTNAAPELIVEVDRAAAAALAVPLSAVSQSLRGATAGLKVKEFRDEDDISKKYDLKVNFSPESRSSVEMLEKIQVRSLTGRLVPLSNFTKVTQGPGINVLRHIDRKRVININAQNRDRPAVEITKDLQDRLENYSLPAGYSFSYAGDIMETQESFDSLKLAYIIAFIIILTILVAQFNSFFQPFAIMVALPLSVVGAVVGLLITGNNFSILSFIGLVGLTGIVVNDSIILVDRINRMRREGQNVYEAIISAGQHRLRPIISTTLTTMGGLSTLTITDKMWEGLGVVIIFGIAFATLLTLVVVPVMYTLFDGFSYHVSSALRGPRWKETPGGRSFFLSRNRWARTKAAFLIFLQVGVLAGGVYYAFPWFVGQYQAQVIQAPTLLKTVLEAGVVYFTFILEAGGLLLVLFIPTWVGLLYLMWLRSSEGYYIDVAPEGMTVASPLEKLFVPRDQIKKVKYSHVTGRLIVKAGPRRLRFRDVVEDRREPVKVPLLSWLNSPRPARRQIRDGMKNLRLALQEITSDRLSDETVG
ncbi:MAG: efflux RND transporter permease subunit [Deltaproteobacteria bacterium]|nr:efflux RND transporter permease subunit [Deltaproteobacteria bacterium]MBW2053247.1 efflux RND transporter permease subunit [Deltaproteobacteria bacterium]MBW2141918.1 efflux RND transporter permease subunit [Deltaproteobacteria bacterium]MBW2323875.1 efflux RND transporter permease subunit [Deltaproteobacteria bacterium]